MANWLVRIPLEAAAYFDKHGVPFGFTQGRLSTTFGWRLTSLGMTIGEGTREPVHEKFPLGPVPGIEKHKVPFDFAQGRLSPSLGMTVQERRDDRSRAGPGLQPWTPTANNLTWQE